MDDSTKRPSRASVGKRRAYSPSPERQISRATRLIGFRAPPRQSLQPSASTSTISTSIAVKDSKVSNPKDNEKKPRARSCRTSSVNPAPSQSRVTREGSLKPVTVPRLSLPRILPAPNTSRLSPTPSPRESGSIEVNDSDAGTSSQSRQRQRRKTLPAKLTIDSQPRISLEDEIKNIAKAAKVNFGVSMPKIIYTNN